MTSEPAVPVAYRSDFAVELVDHMGNDLRVCQAARVSTQGADSFETGESEGLINFLMKNRHGSPFEHVTFTWLVSAPIFVWREFMRHRIASYNEESGRYKQLDAVFYVPPRHRPLRQVGKPGEYTFEPGTDLQYDTIKDLFEASGIEQYERYQYLLDIGVAKEVARMYLPLAIYSSAFVTMNARGLMNFLSLRVKSSSSTFKSFPQWEINQVANAMEVGFAEVAPLVQGAFDENGRVQP